MQTTSKVILSYRIDSAGSHLTAEHETGDDDIYVWKSNGHGSKDIALNLTASEAEELSEALKQLAIKMRHETESVQPVGR